MSNNDKNRGLYRKYDLYRVREDGNGGYTTELVTDPFFVLRYITDPHAAAAFRAYADSCESENPELAADIRRQLGPVDRDPGPGPMKCPDCGAAMDRADAGTFNDRYECPFDQQIVWGAR